MNAFFGEHEESIQEWMRSAGKNSLLSRLWKKDTTLWKGPHQRREIESRLGWLSVIGPMKARAEEFASFAAEVRQLGITHAVLLGMGGSSLAPETFQRVFGSASGYPELIVLDSTDPGRIRDVEARIVLESTLFIFSSKSGSTLEPLSLFKYFFDKLKAVHPQAGERFIAITDPGTSLEALAREHAFWKTFLSPPDVGGRFSALTPFGLVPAALIGVDVAKLLETAEALAKRCAADTPADEHPSLLLGVAMAVLAEAGRDKLTLLLPPAWQSFGDWVEQLVAESSGKEEAGIVPVVGEEPAAPAAYGPDRFFVAVLDKARPGKLKAQLEELKKAGHPVLTFEVREPEEIAGEFFRWEMATAIACALLKVNAFDQPDVQAAKEKAQEILSRLESGRSLTLKRTSASLDSLLTALAAGDYLALLAFLPDRPEIRQRLEKLRAKLRDLTQRVVTLGFGPRYLHSTGQLHKGGPATGVLIVLTAAHEEDIPVPGEAYGFRELELAQALGDVETLEAAGRRVHHAHLPGLTEKDLAAFARAVERAARAGAAGPVPAEDGASL